MLHKWTQGLNANRTPKESKERLFRDARESIEMLRFLCIYTNVSWIDVQ